MAKLTKRKRAWKEKIDKSKKYSQSEGFGLVKEFANQNFLESVDAVIKLGVDPRKSDQVIRGSCSLPHGTGKVERVLVFAKGEKEAEAVAAGADYVGNAELVEKIKGGWTEFDRVIATPDMMAEVGKIGKILGPKGLMPNPKVGTVTFNVGEMISEIKKGQVEFRTDKGGTVHVTVGKTDFDPEKLIENLKAVVEKINRLKPSTAKGQYLKGITVSSSMGPGISLDTSVFL